MSLKGYASRTFESPVSKRYAYVTGHDGNARTQQVVISQEHEYAQNVKEAVCAVYAVAKSGKPVFRLERRRSGCEVLEPCKHGEQLMRALQLPFEDIEATLPRHYFNPLFTLLRQCRDKHVPDGVLLSHWRSLIDFDACALYTALEALVADLREGLKEPAIARDLDSSRRRSDKRWKSVKKTIYESIEDCSRLVAIRVDLHFHMATSLYPFAPTVSEDEACSYMVKFERFLRDRYPLVRYMWSQEYGTQTGFHFHVLVLLNGHLVRDAVGIAMAMGEHWQNVTTEGRGRYFNCNASEYRNPGLGMIERKNPAKVEALVEHVAWYLAKTDFWMRYRATGRSFVTSIRDRQPSAGGAKRSRDPT